ncbi:MAG: peptidylprolyl isomerase [Gammaproteobacteria bacterium]|nr:peptidylprolyl isomerase [Gammaproteobacteria bacterium]
MYHALRFCFLLTSLSLGMGSLALAKGPVIAEVNGEPIDEEVLNLYAVKRLGVGISEGFPDEKRMELLEELINRELIVQDAKQNKMDEEAEITAQLRETIKNTLLQLRIQRLIESNDPDKDLLMTIYKAEIVAKAGMEYKARHILLKTKDEAADMINKLRSGADFAQLASTFSVGPSNSSGGDLGWFASNQVVKPFAEAIEKIKDGKYTQRPVQTRFGWHVILREDSRKIDPPSFDSVKEQVLEIAQNQIIAEFIDKLKEKAEIKIQP